MGHFSPTLSDDQVLFAALLGVLVLRCKIAALWCLPYQEQHCIPAAISQISGAYP